MCTHNIKDAGVNKFSKHLWVSTNFAYINNHNILVNIKHKIIYYALVL